MNGAWYEPERDVWYPAQWDWEGIYASKPSSLDLVNEQKHRKSPRIK